MEATPQNITGQEFDLFQDSPDQHEDTAGWLAWRELGVGGSEIKMLLDEDPHHPGDDGWQYLWRAKMGLPMPERTEALMLAAKRGHKLEPLAIDEMREDTGYEIERVARGIVYPLSPRVRSTLDGVATSSAHDGPGTVEIKTVNEAIFRQIVSKGPRKGDILQLQQNMLVAAHKWGGLFYLHPDSWRRLYFEFPADRDVQQLIVETTEEFWEHVKAGSPPPLKKKPRKANLPAVEGEMAEITDPRMFAAFQDLSAAKRIIKEAEGLKDEAQHAINLLMMENGLQSAEGYGRRVHPPLPGRRTFSKDLLQHHHPDIDVNDDRYYKVGNPSTNFRVFEIKGGE